MLIAQKNFKMDQARKQIASTDIAMANEVFDLFCNATTLKSILGHFRHLCDLLKMRPNTFPQFYPKFKSKLRSWKAQALWKKFDQRANHKCYNRGKASPNTRVNYNSIIIIIIIIIVINIIQQRRKF